MADIFIEPEFSRPVRVAGIPGDGWQGHISADAKERRHLAERLGLEELLQLAGNVCVKPSGDGSYHVAIEFSAEVLQSCVVSLEPVTSLIEERFSVLCRDRIGDERAEVFVEPDGEDPPEPVRNGQIDVGELLVQHLALAIDPYPRRPDARLPADPERESAGEQVGEERENPFAVLAEQGRRR